MIPGGAAVARAFRVAPPHSDAPAIRVLRHGDGVGREAMKIQERAINRLKAGGHAILTKIHLIQFGSPEPVANSND